MEFLALHDSGTYTIPQLRSQSMTKQRAIRKVDIAKDKMVDLQDAGYGCDKVSRILEMLNELYWKIENGDLKPIGGS